MKMKNIDNYLFCFLAVLISCGALVGCSTKPVIVPALSDPASDERLVGKFIWFDLFTGDVDLAADFYSQLFGWETEEISNGKTRVMNVYHDGYPVSNIIAKKSEVPQAKWLAYMSVENVDEVSFWVKANGGQIHTKAKELPNRGRAAVVIDPQGSGFALLTSSSGDVVDVERNHGSWLGCENWTRDVEATVSFYKDLVGYEEKEVDVHDEVSYRLLLKDGQPLAGVVGIPWDDVKPEWLPYVVVNDVAETAALAEELGGRILIKPDLEYMEGYLAIIADPTGAVFGVQQLREVEVTNE